MHRPRTILIVACALLLVASMPADATPLNESFHPYYEESGGNESQGLYIVPRFDGSNITQEWTAVGQRYITAGTAEINAGALPSTGTNQSARVEDIDTAVGFTIEHMDGYGSLPGMMAAPTPPDPPTTEWDVRNKSLVYDGRAVYSHAANLSSEPGIADCWYHRDMAGSGLKIECSVSDMTLSSPGMRIEFDEPVDVWIEGSGLISAPNLIFTPGNITFDGPTEDWTMTWPVGWTDTHVDEPVELYIDPRDPDTVIFQFWTAGGGGTHLSWLLTGESQRTGEDSIPIFEMGGRNNDSSAYWDCRVVISPCSTDDWELPEDHVWWQRAQVNGSQLFDNMSNANNAALNLTINDAACYTDGTIELYMLTPTWWESNHVYVGTSDRQPSALPAAQLQSNLSLADGDADGDGCFDANETISLPAPQLLALAGNDSANASTYYVGDLEALEWVLALKYVGGAGSQPHFSFDVWNESSRATPVVWFTEPPAEEPATAGGGGSSGSSSGGGGQPDAPAPSITVVGDTVTCSSGIVPAWITNLDLRILADGSTLARSSSDSSDVSVTYPMTAGQSYTLTCSVSAEDYDTTTVSETYTPASGGGNLAAPEASLSLVWVFVAVGGIAAVLLALSRLR